MNSPLFSILIAQYNNGRYFEDCYKSIIAQTYQNWEVIIVDDCSTDISTALMMELIGDDSRFKIFSNEANRGCGYTKRRCAELAEGEICGFLDPDDAITRDALEIMVNEHLNHNDASLVYSNFIYCDEHLMEDRIHFQKSAAEKDSPFFNIEGEISHFSTFKKSFYTATSGIDPFYRRAVDQDLYLKLYEAGSVVYIDKNLYLYRVHEGGISTNNNAEKALQWKKLAVLESAKRRNIDIESLFWFLKNQSQRERDLEFELAEYNNSKIFKTLRKMNVFKLF